MEMQMEILSATGIGQSRRRKYYVLIDSGGQRQCTNADAQARWKADLTLDLPCAEQQEQGDADWSVALRLMREGPRILGGHRPVGSVVLRGRDLLALFRYAPAHVRSKRFVSYRLSAPSGRPSPVVLHLSLGMQGLGYAPTPPAALWTVAEPCAQWPWPWRWPCEAPVVGHPVGVVGQRSCNCVLGIAVPDVLSASTRLPH